METREKVARSIFEIGRRTLDIRSKISIMIDIHISIIPTYLQVECTTLCFSKIGMTGYHNIAKREWAMLPGGRQEQVLARTNCEESEEVSLPFAQEASVDAHP